MNLYRQLRKAKNLTQKELAEILYLDQTTVSKWELGKAVPDFSTLNKLADFYNVSTDYLLGRSTPISNDAIQQQAKTEKSDIELIFESLNPRQQANLLAYAEGLLAANDTTLEELKMKKA